MTRDCALLQRHDGIRRSRKSLLSELSSLVKTAKRLLEAQKAADSTEDVNDIVDEMILRAFKIVTKGVRFLDLWEDDKRETETTDTDMGTGPEETQLPLSPPADTSAFDDAPRGRTGNASSRGAGSGVATELLRSPSSEGTQTTGSTNKRLSSVYPSASTNSRRLSHKNQLLVNRLSSTLSHRVSLAGTSPLPSSRPLVSQRLAFHEDSFVSQLASFIGRLHLQSQRRPHLALEIKECAMSGGDLLVVVDMVAALHNAPDFDIVCQLRAMVSDRIRDLVYAGRDILSNPSIEFGDIIMPDDNNRLMRVATDCVRAAGECANKAMTVIHRIGDFEIGFDKGSPCIEWDLSCLDGIQDEESTRRPSTATASETASITESSISEAPTTTSTAMSVVSSMPPSRPHALSIDKPLPEVPQTAAPSAEQPHDGEGEAHSSPPVTQTQSPTEDTHPIPMSPLSALRPSLPPLPKITTAMLPQEEYSPTEHSAGHEHGFQSFSSRSESMTASSMDSSKTYLSRDSEASMVSQTSTRATTPDISSGPKNQPSLSDLSTNGSTNMAEDAEEVETKLLEKTFAHELLFNKEGQVTGGSLAALVERLTTHESTPDAMFVSTFYLTFRLFCTPMVLAECLIDRFDYVGEAPHMASPVRLRVYNVFKGWLESHWRDDVDREALPVIQQFAEFKLSSILPSAGKRLLELTLRVMSMDGTLVPRLVSSMGKTSTSISQYVPADLPVPAPVLSKSQINLLNNWKAGGTCPTVLDFDPLEVARQLTVKAMTAFCSILPEELLGSQWMKKGGVDAPNVKAMSTFSTDLSNLVADTILQYSEVKRRASAIKQWIKIAHQCFELNNYDALMAIICSLNSSTITRLRKTWDLISLKRRQMLKHLQAIVEPSQNNKVLRARLQGHVPPCLPFLGMFLTDLTFVDIGNPATKTNDSGLTLVNFDKHTRTAKIIGELQRFQIPYRLTEVPDLQEWIRHQVERVRELEAQQGNSVQVSYYRKSLLLEPRETQALRAPVEAPVAIPATGNSMFGWMRSTSNTSTATVSTSNSQLAVPTHI